MFQSASLCPIALEQGILEMDSDLLPELRSLLDGRAIPRVLPSYAIMLWFTLQVCNYTFFLTIYLFRVSPIEMDEPCSQANDEPHSTG